MEAESEEDDDDDDDDGKKVSGDITQRWGGVVLEAVAICHCLPVHFTFIFCFLFFISLSLMCTGFFSSLEFTLSLSFTVYWFDWVLTKRVNQFFFF